MAECHLCGREMTTADSCTLEALHQHGRRYPLARFGEESGWRGRAERCGDCGVAKGGLHHPGCDLQDCPVYGGQLLSCGCGFDEEGFEQDDDADDADDARDRNLLPESDA
jgi:hypothetical protein